MVLGADGKRGVADIVDVVGAHEHELPTRTVVGEEELGVAGIGRHRVVDEVGIAAHTHRNLLTGEFYALIHVGLVDAEGCYELTGVGIGFGNELDIVAAFHLALPCDEAVGTGRNIADGAEFMDNHLRGIRQTIGLYMAVEQLRCHESSLPGISRLVVFGPAYLLQAVVFADIHTGEIHNQLLADAVVEEEIIGVDREGQRSRLVLDGDALEDVAALVGSDDAAGHDIMRAVGLGADFLDIVCGVVPELLLQVEDSGVGLVGGHRHRGLRSVDIVLAGSETAEECQRHHAGKNRLIYFHNS